MTDPTPVPAPAVATRGVPDGLLRDVGSATGAARAGVDLARHGTGHTARQIVYALAEGAAEDPELRVLLSELAAESEDLSGQAVRLYSRLLETERDTGTAEPTALSAAVEALNAVHADGLALHDAAVKVRRRLPRAYGDPLALDRDWPTA